MDEADYIIVGGGTAGCVLANRLSASGEHRVLVLEAGGSDRSPLISAPGGMWPIMRSGAFSWQYRTAPQRQLGDRVFTMPRGKVIGGSSSTNGMVCSRGAREDYERWREFGIEGWSYADVLPWFRRLESHPLGPDEYHGSEGPLQMSRPGAVHPLSKAFIAAAAQAGFPLNEDTDGATREGFGPLDLMISGGQRSSSARAYLRPALSRPNLAAIRNAHVVRIVTKDRIATGVEYRHGGRLQRATATREVIVCAGAIQSPQLLMLSGIGPAEELRELALPVVHDLSGVGRGLQDHVAIAVKYTVTQPITLLRYRSPWRLALALSDYLLLKRGPLANPGLEVVAFVMSAPSMPRPDLRFQLVLALLRSDKRGMIPCHGFQIRASLARVASVGSVRLTSPDPMQPPLVDQNYLSDPDERAALRAAVRIMRRLCAAPAFDAYRGEELEPGPDLTSDEELDAFISAKADPDYHTVGTCRMGIGADTMAVVDAECRVHGVARLRVVDASVIPRALDGGPCLPAIMIAERISAAILRAPVSDQRCIESPPGVK